MKIRFLGIGNAFNNDGLANQSILIEHNKSSYCIDAGPTLLYQLQRYSIDPPVITHIFITHFHGDHTAGIPFLLLYLYENIPAYKLIIYGPSGIKDVCKRLNQAAYANIPIDMGVEYIEIPVQPHNNIPLNTGDAFSVFPMDHNVESIGYQLHTEGKTIAITGDTRWNQGILDLSRNCDLLITECTFVSPLKTSHMSFKQIKENIDLINAKSIVPIHMYKPVRDAFIEWNNSRIKLVDDGDTIVL